MRHLATAAALLLLAAGPAAAQAITLSPAQIGEIFCIARLGNDMAPVEGLLTDGLRDAIAAAQAVSDDIARQHPDEKPPLGDGVPWQAFPDYAPQCRAGSAILQMDESRVPVSYVFPDSPEADFADTLVLRLVPLAADPGSKVGASTMSSMLASRACAGSSPASASPIEPRPSSHALCA